MKAKFILVIAMIIELVLNVIFPYSLSDQVISISPSFFLIVLIVSQRKYDLLDNLITCIVSLMIYSYLFNLPMILTVMIYTALFFVSKIWSRNILDSYLELTVLSVAIVFVKDWIVHIIRYFVYHKNVNLLQVLGNRITPSIIANLILTIIFVVLYQMYLDYSKVKNEMGRKNEKIYMFDYLRKK